MKTLALKNRVIKTELPAFVMGIVNATPDSFWEESRGDFERAISLVNEGADIIDIGGESSRPGSGYVSAEDEIKRIIPVIEKIRRVSDVPISVDTRKKIVMEEAVRYGADILNDISALEDAPSLGSFCAKQEIPVILMHKRGNPTNMQQNTNYEDVFSEVNEYLLERAKYAENCGILPEKIIVDPGIGFGKNLYGNCELIKKLKFLCEGKYFILMALSRKSFLGEITGKNTEERLYATLAANLVSVINGAGMIRVHDVKQAVDTLKVLKYVG